TAGTNPVVFGADAGSLKATQAINSSVAAGSDAVRVGGAGTIVISAAQTYAGNTRVVPMVSGTTGQNVQAGTLKLEGAGAVASSLHVTGGGNVIIDSSATGATRATALQVGDATITVNGNSSNNTNDSLGNLDLGSAGAAA